VQQKYSQHKGTLSFVKMPADCNLAYGRSILECGPALCDVQQKVF
jgi:hypothetical protein